MPSYNDQYNNQATRRRIMNMGSYGGGRGAGGRITKMFVGNLSFDTTWQGEWIFIEDGFSRRIEWELNFLSS